MWMEFFLTCADGFYQSLQHSGRLIHSGENSLLLKISMLPSVTGIVEACYYPYSLQKQIQPFIISLGMQNKALLQTRSTVQRYYKSSCLKSCGDFRCPLLQYRSLLGPERLLTIFLHRASYYSTSYCLPLLFYFWLFIA